jgi:flagellar assembly factor FliW
MASGLVGHCKKKIHRPIRPTAGKILPATAAEFSQTCRHRVLRWRRFIEFLAAFRAVQPHHSHVARRLPIIDAMMTNTDTIELTQPSAMATVRQQPVRLPLGLLGFEPYKDFILSSERDEAPFQWLLSADNPQLSFLVVSPFEADRAYQPDVEADDVRWLDLREPKDALLLAIVTLRANGPATVNLKGPIVFNRHTLVGKQIVPRNAANYSSQHPLPQSH